MGSVGTWRLVSGPPFAATAEVGEETGHVHHGNGRASFISIRLGTSCESMRKVLSSEYQSLTVFIDIDVL